MRAITQKLKKKRLKKEAENWERPPWKAII